MFFFVCFLCLLRKKCSLVGCYISCQPFLRNFSLPENEESTHFFVNLFAIILVLGHKSSKKWNYFSDAFHHTSTLNLKLCHMKAPIWIQNPTKKQQKYIYFFKLNFLSDFVTKLGNLFIFCIDFMKNQVTLIVSKKVADWSFFGSKM